MDGGTGQEDVMLTIVVPDNLLDVVRNHIGSGNLADRCTLSQQSSLGNNTSKKRPECTTETLHSGGWIACPTALALAENLGVPPPKVGRLLDLLKIKVKRCSLGLFE